MNKNIPRLMFFALISVLAAIWIYFPNLLGEDNERLNEFFDKPFLGVLGFVISVTVGSCANVVLKLTQLEKDGIGPFPSTKSKLSSSAYSLIFLFAFSFVGLVLKSMFADSGERWIAAWNAIFICVMYFFIAVLLDVTRTTFRASSIEP